MPVLADDDVVVNRNPEHRLGKTAVTVPLTVQLENPDRNLVRP
jgi:hypothetical protein